MEVEKEEKKANEEKTETQAITVGGANHRGEDQSNPATLWFLEAADMLRAVSYTHLTLPTN